jgi:hypothetical protein
MKISQAWLDGPDSFPGNIELVARLSRMSDCATI